MGEIVKLIGAASIGAFLTLIVQWLRASRDDTKQLGEEFCRAIETAGDAATEYWLASSIHTDVPVSAARLIGHQAKLAGFVAIISTRLLKRDRDVFVVSLAKLYDSMTGGEFNQNSIVNDPNRAVDAQKYSAEAVRALREAYLKSIRLRELFFGFRNFYK